MAPASQHGTCVDIGGRGVLIRGPSGAGKSTLALRLMLDPPAVLPRATLVADDRVLLHVQDGVLIAEAPDTLAGIIEVRNLGLRRVPHVSRVKLTLLIDLADPQAERLPDAGRQWATLNGIRIFRIAIPAGADAALLIAAALETAPAEEK